MGEGRREREGEHFPIHLLATTGSERLAVFRLH